MFFDISQTSGTSPRPAAGAGRAVASVERIGTLAGELAALTYSSTHLSMFRTNMAAAAARINEFLSTPQGRAMYNRLPAGLRLKPDALSLKLVAWVDAARDFGSVWGRGITDLYMSLPGLDRTLLLGTSNYEDPHAEIETNTGMLLEFLDRAAEILRQQSPEGITIKGSLRAPKDGKPKAEGGLAMKSRVLTVAMPAVPGHETDATPTVYPFSRASLYCLIMPNGKVSFTYAPPHTPTKLLLRDSDTGAAHIVGFKPKEDDTTLATSAVAVAKETNEKPKVKAEDVLTIVEIPIRVVPKLAVPRASAYSQLSSLFGASTSLPAPNSYGALSYGFGSAGSSLVGTGPSSSAARIERGAAASRGESGAAARPGGFGQRPARELGGASGASSALAASAADAVAAAVAAAAAAGAPSMAGARSASAGAGSTAGLFALQTREVGGSLGTIRAVGGGATRPPIAAPASLLEQHAVQAAPTQGAKVGEKYTSGIPDGATIERDDTLPVCVTVTCIAAITKAEQIYTPEVLEFYAMQQLNMMGGEAVARVVASPLGTLFETLDAASAAASSAPALSA